MQSAARAFKGESCLIKKSWVYIPADFFLFLQGAWCDLTEFRAVVVFNQRPLAAFKDPFRCQMSRLTKHGNGMRNRASSHRKHCIIVYKCVFFKGKPSCSFQSALLLLIIPHTFLFKYTRHFPKIGSKRLKINQFSWEKKNGSGMSSVHLDLKQDNMFPLLNEENRFE